MPGVCDVSGRVCALRSAAAPRAARVDCDTPNMSTVHCGPCGAGPQIVPISTADDVHKLQDFTMTDCPRHR